MAASFAEWEKDPFFTAADEVQDAADRMESLHRLWIQARSDAPGALRRDLHASLGTAKWQLEELERAMSAHDELSSAAEDAKSRHAQFVSAIEGRISEAESSLKEFGVGAGESDLAWIQLDTRERDELARFLSGAAPEQESPPVPSEEKAFECQRTASGEWKILVPSDDSLGMSSDGEITRPILGFSGLINVVESACGTDWYRNGFRKWKGRNRCDATAESIGLCNHELSQGVEACFQRSEGCLGGCDDDCYDDKKLNGWIGALFRQLQRSRYQIQYSHPTQVFVCVMLAILLIALFATHAM